MFTCFYLGIKQILNWSLERLKKTKLKTTYDVLNVLNLECFKVFFLQKKNHEKSFIVPELQKL